MNLRCVIRTVSVEVGSNEASLPILFVSLPTVLSHPSHTSSIRVIHSRTTTIAPAFSQRRDTRDFSRIIRDPPTKKRSVPFGEKEEHPSEVSCHWDETQSKGANVDLVHNTVVIRTNAKQKITTTTTTTHEDFFVSEVVP
jgi:hypothetical protein